MKIDNQSRLDQIQIRTDIHCGDLGRIISLHGVNYEPLGGYGLAFEAYVAKTIAEYVLENHSKGRIWIAEQDGAIVGCAAIADREDSTGQLRWVLVDPGARGIGLGRKLVEAALEYCRESGFTSVYLETTVGLPESMALYRKLGFENEAEETVELWDGMGSIITMRLDMHRIKEGRTKCALPEPPR